MNIVAKARGSLVDMETRKFVARDFLIFTDDLVIYTEKGIWKTLAVGDDISAADGTILFRYDDMERFETEFRGAGNNGVFFFTITISGHRFSLRTTRIDRKGFDLESFLYGKLLAGKQSHVGSISEAMPYTVFSARHISGLPLPEGSDVKISASSKGLVFVYAEQVIRLAQEKIFSCSIQTDTEIKTEYKSSICDAILGAHFGGVAGAVIGGQPRLKRTQVQRHFLIVTYRKGEDFSYLSFYLQDPSVAAVLVKAMKTVERSPSQPIEL